MRHAPPFVILVASLATVLSVAQALVATQASPQPVSSPNATPSDKDKTEIKRIEAETRKLEVEAEKLQAESKSVKPQWLNYVDSIGQFLAGLVGVSAIGALVYQFIRTAQQRETAGQRRREEEFSKLLQDTASKNPAIRSVAADRLRIYLGGRSNEEDRRLSDHVIARLVAALATEEDPIVRWTVGRVLASGGLHALPMIDDIYGKLVQQLAELIVPRMPPDLARKVKAMQNALLEYAEAKRKITKSDRLDLRRARLSCLRLAERDFRRADLTGAYIHSADLWHCKFGGATLVDGDAAGVYATGADFRGADLSGCKFSGILGDISLGADIEDADLREATGLDVESFRWTNWRKARFDEAFRRQLERAYPGEGEGLVPKGPGRDKICEALGLE